MEHAGTPVRAAASTPSRRRSRSRSRPRPVELPHRARIHGRRSSHSCLQLAEPWPAVLAPRNRAWRSSRSCPAELVLVPGSGPTKLALTPVAPPSPPALALVASHPLQQQSPRRHLLRQRWPCPRSEMATSPAPGRAHTYSWRPHPRSRKVVANGMKRGRL